jgi:hypothetical protein
MRRRNTTKIPMPQEVVDRVHALCKSKKQNTESIVHNMYAVYHDYSKIELDDDDDDDKDEDEDFVLQDIHEDFNLIGDG